MNEHFSDPHPGAPKILFIGMSESSHNQAWLRLLEGAGLNVRFFSLPALPPPDDWPFPTYITTTSPPSGLNPAVRQSHYPLPDLIENLPPLPQRIWNRAVRLIGRESVAIDEMPQMTRMEAWLAEIIRNWQPDVIETIGLCPPAAALYLRTREQYGLQGIGKWVLHTRGGSDLSLARHDPDEVARIIPIVKACDQIICDNYANFDYLRAMGAREVQFSSLGPVPGTGGVDVDALSMGAVEQPSSRRTILWPKAYDITYSVALPVFEGIKIAWERIQPCEIVMLNMVIDSTRAWYKTLPEDIRRACRVHNKLPRDDVFKLMARARVVLAPSLVDGVPNVLYEAMASGALPIVSPLETITPIVKQDENVLFARNLYPHEIADALIRAMTDDGLIDAAAKRNLERVRELADRKAIAPRVIQYYQSLA